MRSHPAVPASQPHVRPSASRHTLGAERDSVSGRLELEGLRWLGSRELDILILIFCFSTCMVFGQLFLERGIIQRNIQKENLVCGRLPHDLCSISMYVPGYAGVWARVNGETFELRRMAKTLAKLLAQLTEVQQNV
jgi:hypothetical protein